MRLPSVALLIALVVPLSATAQPTKQVEVTNFPDPQNVVGTVEITNDETNPVEVVGEVEVTNLPTAAGRFQLVGFTSATYLGNVGLFAFTRGCGAEFPSSRMCRSEEILETVAIPTDLAGTVWVQPSIVAGGAQFALNLADASGISNNSQQFSCNSSQSWSNLSSSGLVVDFEGRIGFQSCSTARGVSCCAPVP